MKACTTCNRETNDFVEFRCPKCGKSSIVRCQQCRRTAKTYKCEECGFVGP